MSASMCFAFIVFAKVDFPEPGKPRTSVKRGFVMIWMCKLQLCAC
ncbi:hypothetical protein VIBNIAM115_490009 [Vibrio nigripulchritudo AM115]|nr:hypothetical protein VIBNIAM115_490009 [Vibrio nigripulchritudo AM115]